jgi:spermidine synthase
VPASSSNPAGSNPPLAAVPVPAPALAIVLLLFAGSGCAALIYEIVWFQLLSLVVGSSAVSIGVLLGTYMGGLCLGSLAFARMVSWRHDPLRVYAALEIGIAACAGLILLGLPYAGGLYIAVGGHGTAGLLFRGLLSGLCLLPPTVLMGATLPAMSRWVEASPRGVAWLGLFYGANTVGAVFGCLLAGYYLLRVHDVTYATWVAVAINLAVALSGWVLSALAPAPRPTQPTDRPTGASAAGSWPVYLTIAVSGMTALSAEVVWTRLLSLLLGATVYTFSLILAVFLVGLAFGSAAGSAATRLVASARATLGVCQCLLVAAILWAAYSLTTSLPYWPVSPGLAMSPIYRFQIDLARCLWAILPAACLWGASFPLALASVVPDREDLGRLVGRVYAANTVGGILGAIATSLLFVPWLGSQQSQRILVALTALSATLVLVPVPSGSGELVYAWKRVLPGALALAFLRWITASVPQVPPELVAWGHNLSQRQGTYGDILFVGEGMNSSMAVSRIGGVLSYHNAGKIQASSLPKDMRLQRMLGHLATLVPEHPREVLVIACGAGVTAGAVSIDPAVEHETIAEIEALVPRKVAPMFAEENFNVVKSPKVHFEIDDARHFVLTTKKKFDAITSDPFDPWVKGAATLYTREFFDLLKRHLNPGGVVTIFVQLYESSEDAVRSEVATFVEAFPDGVVFGNTDNGQGYDVVLLGQVDPAPINLDAIQQRLRRPEYAAVVGSLQQIGFASALQLFSTYAARVSQMRDWLAGAEINRDRNLRLQYLAGLGLNLHEENTIYSHMTQYWQYPEDLFLGSSENVGALRAAMLAR